MTNDEMTALPAGTKIVSRYDEATAIVKGHDPKTYAQFEIDMHRPIYRQPTGFFGWPFFCPSPEWWDVALTTPRDESCRARTTEEPT